MANSWLRLWHEMPNDPKWRTIARISKQPISAVIAVALHVMVNASENATERGRTQNVNSEDIASALDIETADVSAILDAMQTRFLDGDRIISWQKRQPLKEDGAAERAKEWREAQKLKKQLQEAIEERDRALAERNRTHANATEQQDKDKEEDKEYGSAAGAAAAGAAMPSGNLSTDPKQKPPADPVKAEVWHRARLMTEAAQIPDRKARDAIGKLVKEYGLPVMLEAVRIAEPECPIEPIAFLTGICQRLKGERRSPNKQEQLEAANRAVVDQMMAEEGQHAAQ